MNIDKLNELINELEAAKGELFDHRFWRDAHVNVPPPKVTHYFIHHQQVDPKELCAGMFTNIEETNKIAEKTQPSTRFDLGLDETREAHLFFPWLFHHHGYHELVGKDEHGNPIRAPTMIEGAVVILHLIENHIVDWSVARVTRTA